MESSATTYVNELSLGWRNGLKAMDRAVKRQATAGKLGWTWPLFSYERFERCSVWTCKQIVVLVLALGLQSLGSFCCLGARVPTDAPCAALRRRRHSFACLLEMEISSRRGELLLSDTCLFPLSLVPIQEL